MAMPDHDARLDRLLTASAKVFADKGFHAATMRDLARETGLSLAGIYHYVDGKDALLYRIQQRCFSRVLSGAETTIRSGEGAVDRLERFIRHHVTFFARHRAETKVLSHEANSLPPDLVEEINDLKRRYADLLTNLVRDVQRSEGETRGDPRLAAYALFGMMNWTYTWYDPNGPVPPDVLADHFAGWFIHGLLGRVAGAVPNGR